MISKVQLAFGSAILTFVVLGAISFRAVSLSGESDGWVRHTHETLEALQGLLIAMEDIEASYRGFALTGNGSYLESYAANVATARRDQVAIGNLTRDNPRQQVQLPALVSLITEKSQFGETIIALRRTEGLEATTAAIKKTPARDVMAELQALVRSMQDEELRLLILRTAEASRRLAQTRTLLIAGTVLGLLITTAATWSVRRDSARRAMVEEELRRGKEQLMAVLENIGDGVVVAYAEGGLAHFNAAAQRMLGRGPSEGSWAREFDVFRVDGVTPFPADELPLGLAMSGIATDHVDLLVRRATGGPGVFVSVTGRPINDSNGLVIGGVVILHDITERKRAEQKLTQSAQELRNSNQELERFAFVASHDLQAPLRMVVSYVELIERRYADKLDASAREFIDYAIGGARRMQTLITDLLALSRVGTHPYSPVPVNSSETLNQVLLTLRLPIEDAGASISRDDLPQVMADAVQLGQVFQNLIVNALKFHGDNPPQVEISARCESGECEFLVADNGVGIAPEHRENIFVMFERVPGTQKHAGTGIGLATCKKIVERHGGRIWVEAGAGTGSVFHFTLPAAPAVSPMSAGAQTGA